MVGKVVAVCKSVHKGERKVNIGQAQLIEDFGMDGDAHAGPWDTHIRLLSQESIYKALKRGLSVGPGDFSENITTRGIDLSGLPVGTKLKVGETILEITQKGKVCRKKCTIFDLIGDCIMPNEGVYARVLQGGNVSVGDSVQASLDITIGIINVAPGCNEEKLVGTVISETISRCGAMIAECAKTNFTRDDLKDAIIEMCDKGIHIVFTVGGAGISIKDNAPEAILEVVEKELPGVSDNIRRNFQKQKDAIIFRGRAGIRGNSIIVNLPDDEKILRNSLPEILLVLAQISGELNSRNTTCALVK